MTASGPATLDSVAAHAGVSRQTVSNVLRHPDRVAAPTRERVLAAIAETGYRPSLPARQLATRRAHAIAVRAERQQDGISGLVLDAFYHGLAEAGQDNGLRVLLYAQPEDEAAEIATIDELVHTGAADAVVLTATSADDERPAHLRERGTTFCAFGRPWGHDEPHDWVDVDGAIGTGLAVSHLLDLGRRRIAYLGWPDDGEQPSTGTERRRGWREALASAGLGGAPVEVRSTNDAAAAESAVARLLAGRDAPDSIVCASDTLALGAHRAAVASSGDQVTVVGFDATPVAAALGLASVAQPIDQVAHLCIDLLTRRFEKPLRPAQGLLVPPVLHVPR
ncbi:LacI family DNA-binding transcriptional regulator [Nocardia sp. N13]|uniref:LacI family DNA-binding transcriptional regulator n=1 Tax=Nocardioides sp. N13(2025) TaxID=3453405 RepID=UPI003F75D919